jgi:hypothetical protein
MWWSLGSIIILEAFIIARLLEAPLRPVLAGAAVANVASTIVGEAPIVRRIAGLAAAPKMRKAVLAANLASYAGLGLVIAVTFAAGWRGFFAGRPMSSVVERLAEFAFRNSALQIGE